MCLGGCGEKVAAAAAKRREQIKEWQAEQLAYDRKAHGIVDEEQVAESESEEDDFWDKMESLIGTPAPEPDEFQPIAEEKNASNQSGGTIEEEEVKKAIPKKVSAAKKSSTPKD